MRNFYLTAVLLLSATFSFGQSDDHGSPAHTVANRTTGTSGTGANIDVYNYQIFWRINPDTTDGAPTPALVRYIRGIVMIKFQTTVANVQTVSFDLSSFLTITELRHHGVNIIGNVTRTGNTFTVDIPDLPTINSRDSIVVHYRGTPPPTSLGGVGYQHSSGSTPAGTANYIYTLSESYEDRDWWPCKADMQDKPDTTDITISTPWDPAIGDTFWAAAPGRLVDSTIIGTTRYFKFLNRYPMATYLVSACVARYKRFYDGTVNINGDQVPVVYYLFSGRTDANCATIRSVMNEVTQLVSIWSTKFGFYPFSKEKHGFYEGLELSGGMEHQGFSAMSTGSISSRSTLAHELIHQWFGDKVTFSRWSDLWLAEGFARWGEGYAAELIPMGYTAQSNRSGSKTSALGDVNTPAFIPVANNSDDIWATDHALQVYRRGAMVVSMLRVLAGETKFFQALTNYMNDPKLAYKSATTDSLRKHFAALIDIGPDSLKQFFDDNVKGVGNPVHNISYQFHGAGNRSVIIKRGTQGKNPTSNPTVFSQPIILHFKKTTAPTRDTTVILFDREDSLFKVSNLGIQRSTRDRETQNYVLSFAPDLVTFDDSSRIMATAVLASSNTIVDLQIIDFTGKRYKHYNRVNLTLDDNRTQSDIVLERASDGINFTPLGSMTAMASVSNKKYDFNDLTPLAGPNFYRATFKNRQGLDIYSTIVKLEGNSPNSFSLIENPATELLQVRVPTNISGQIRFEIFDGTSRLVYTNAVTNPGAIERLDIKKLNASVYFLRITEANGNTQELKFVKK